MNKVNGNTRLIEYILGILATLMIAAGLLLYALDESERIDSAQAYQIHADLDEAMSLYAENCSVCHGLAGEGIGATPALNTPALASSDFNTLVKVITRGLYNTAMPAWGQSDGGPLSDYQIAEMALLIQQGDWQQTQERVVNLGLAPRVPFTTEPDPAILEQIQGLPDGASLVQGINIYAGQCVACHGADGLGSTLAPALNDPLVRAKSVDDLENTVLNGVTGTLMASWESQLSDDELASVLNLIARWDVVPVGAIPAPDRPVAVTAESLALGAELFTANCSRCHGPEGQGTQRAPSLNVKSFLADTSDAAMQQIITLGVSGTSMPAWGDRLSDAEIQAVVGFMRAWEPTAPEVAAPARASGPWWRSNTTQPGGQTNVPPWQLNVQAAPQTGQATGGQNSASGGTGASSGTQGTHTQQGQAGSGPPWAQPAPPPWWQNLDWRAWSLLGGVLALAFVLILVGLVGIRRYPGIVQ